MNLKRWSIKLSKSSRKEELIPIVFLSLCALFVFHLIKGMGDASPYTVVQSSQIDRSSWQSMVGS